MQSTKEHPINAELDELLEMLATDEGMPERQDESEASR